MGRRWALDVVAVCAVAAGVARAGGGPAAATGPAGVWRPGEGAVAEARALLGAAVEERGALVPGSQAYQMTATAVARAWARLGEDERAEATGADCELGMGADFARREVAVTHAEAGDAAGAMAAVGRLSEEWKTFDRGETLATVALGLIRAGRREEGGRLLADTYAMVSAYKEGSQTWRATGTLAGAMHATGDAAGAKRLFARAEEQARVAQARDDAQSVPLRLSQLASIAMDVGALDVAGRLCDGAGIMARLDRARLTKLRVRRGDAAGARRDATALASVEERVAVLQAMAEEQVKVGDEGGVRQAAADVEELCRSAGAGQVGLWRATAVVRALAGDRAGAVEMAARIERAEAREVAMSSVAMALACRGDWGGAKEVALKVTDPFSRGYGCGAVALEALRQGRPAADVAELLATAREAFDRLEKASQRDMVASPLVDALIMTKDVAGACRVLRVAHPQPDDYINTLAYMAGKRLRDPARE